MKKPIPQFPSSPRPNGTKSWVSALAFTAEFNTQTKILEKIIETIETVNYSLYEPDHDCSFAVYNQKPCLYDNTKRTYNLPKQ